MSKAEQSKLGSLRRKDLQAVACILILTISVTLLQGGITPPSFVQTELLDTSTIESWVPFFVLYDPPGSASYARFSMNGSEGIKMRFEGQASDFQVIGEFTIRTSFSYAETPRSHFDSAILMMLLNQTWELTRYSFLGQEWVEANLVNYSILGHGMFGFDDIDEHGVWINDLTNTTSEYSLELDVSTGTVETMTIECLGKVPQIIGAGYNVSLFGAEISISILVSPQNFPFTISYVFSNETTPLSFNLFSDTPISQEPYQTDGVLLWFG